MKIAYLCADVGVPVYGTKGAAIHVRELCRALVELGHEVEILAARTGGPLPPDFVVPVHEVGLGRVERLTCGALRDDPAAGEPVAKELRAMLHAAALRQRGGAIVRGLRSDAIYERYSLYGAAGLELARELGIPLVLEVNAPLSEEQAAHRGLAFTRTARTVERAILTGADRVVAVSEPLRAWLHEAGVDPARVTVLPNGVDVDRFAGAEERRAAVRAGLGVADGDPVVGFVGTLKAWHGTASLIAAVAALRRRGRQPSPRLLIVGDGPERAALEARAAREGIAAATTFTGAIPHERIPAYLAAMDVAVAPYDQQGDFYFSPLKLFEYLAAGKPTVAAAVGQIAACLRHEETGLLYPPGDADALAAAIGRLLDDAALAARLGRTGQADVRTHRTWRHNAAAVADLMRQAGPELDDVRPTLEGVGADGHAA